MAAREAEDRERINAECAQRHISEKIRNYIAHFADITDEIIICGEARMKKTSQMGQNMG